MRARQFGPWLLVVNMLLAACQSAPALSAPPATVNSVSASLPTPLTETSSGVHLTADIALKCAGLTRPNAECVQPYAGEFVITAPNGAEVMRVTTDAEGQAEVDLPPGKYILGVRTEDIYPLAAPVKVDVIADDYVQVSLRLDSGE